MPCYSFYFNKIVIPKHRYAFGKFVTKNHGHTVVSGKWHQNQIMSKLYKTI